MINDNDKTELIKKQILTFFKNNLPIHISYKGKDLWHNGYILSLDSADFFMLNEFRFGVLPVFYLQIDDVSKYIKEEKKDEQR